MDVPASAPQASQQRAAEVTNLNQSIQCIMQFEKHYQESLARMSWLEERIQQLNNKIEQLEEENSRLRQSPVTPISGDEQLSEDSKTLLSIMDRARKMFDMETPEPKVKFKMDRNGNLERIQEI